jgi:hypothetical protein
MGNTIYWFSNIVERYFFQSILCLCYDCCESSEIYLFTKDSVGNKLENKSVHGAISRHWEVDECNT